MTEVIVWAGEKKKEHSNNEEILRGYKSEKLQIVNLYYEVHN